MLTYETIVVGTDFSARALEGIEAAAEFATHVRAKRLHIVHATHLPYYQSMLLAPEAPLDHMPDELVQGLIADAERRLAELELPKTTAEITREVRFGVPVRELVRVCEEIAAELLIVTSRSMHGVARFIVGSTASTAIRTAHCPVLTLRDHPDRAMRFSHVVAAIDLSPVSMNVLKNAVAMTSEGGRVEVISCYEAPLIKTTVSALYPREVETDPETTFRLAARSLVDRVSKPGVDINLDIVRKSPAAQVVMDVVEMTKPDLLVVGTSDHGALYRMILGSTANRALVETQCPVLTVPFDAKLITDVPALTTPPKSM